MAKEQKTGTMYAEHRPLRLMLSASGHDLSQANILYSPHYGGFNRNAFALYGLQFHADGRKIAL